MFTWLYFLAYQAEPTGMDNWQSIFFKLVDNSLAIALLFVGIRLLVKVGQWLGKEVIIPARDKGFNHLDKTNTALDNLSTTMVAVRTELATQTEKVNEKREQLSGDIQEVGTKLELVHLDVKAIKGHLRVNEKDIHSS